MADAFICCEMITDEDTGIIDEPVCRGSGKEASTVVCGRYEDVPCLGIEVFPLFPEGCPPPAA